MLSTPFQQQLLEPTRSLQNLVSFCVKGESSTIDHVPHRFLPLERLPDAMDPSSILRSGQLVTTVTGAVHARRGLFSPPTSSTLLRVPVFSFRAYLSWMTAGRDAIACNKRGCHGEQEGGGGRGGERYDEGVVQVPCGEEGPRSGRDVRVDRPEARQSTFGREIAK